MGTCSNQKLGGPHGRFHMSQYYTHLTLYLVPRAFIRFSPFYLQISLSSSWHRFKKMLKTFQNLVSKLCAVHPWCVSPVPAHPKGPPLDWVVTWSPFEYTDLTVMNLLHNKSLLPSSSTVSLSTQTENFFTTELSSYLSFCQKNRPASLEDLKPLDLSLPHRARKDHGSCLSVMEVQVSDMECPEQS